MSGVTNPPPVAVLQSYADVFANGANGASLRYDLPLPDGAYDVRLFFVEPSGGNVRRFDVRLQGQTVLDNYNIQADAGAVRKAVAKSFAVSATEGQGLTLQLVNDGTAAGFDAVISGIEITRAYPAAPATFAANVEFSANNGQTWSTIATNVPANRFGEGSLTWNATAGTNGNTGRFRLTALGDGVPGVQQVSETFSVSNNGNAFYVNIAADSDLSDNEFTTASGDNLHTGKSPNSPMKSLDALVRAYDLDAGDTIYVDSGTYGRLLTNATLTAEDSGVTLQGPTQSGHAAVLTRGTSAVGSAVLELTGGVTDIVVDALELHTAENGISLVSGANIEIRNSVIRNNSNRGIDVNSGASNVRIVNNQIRENTSLGIETRGSQITVENNLIRNSDRGIKVNGTLFGNVVIRDNDIFGHNVGVETSGINVVGNVIQGNTIHDNATHGIFASGGSAGGLQIVGNEVYGHAGTNDVGIFYSVSGGFAMTISDNLVHHNYFGFDIPSVTGTIRRNRIYANSSAGIRQSGTSNVLNNQIYSNATGILLTGTSTTSTVRNNLIYDNTNVGIDVSNGNYLITDNTIVHPVGIAVRFTANGTGRLKNNIVQGDVGTLVSVATGGQAAFVSDYNLLYPTSAAANVGLWGSTVSPELGDWQSSSGRDANSLSANPLFLDIDGADNVLGEQGVPEGNGFDDNFGLQAHSPAIDRGETWNASVTDLLNRSRQDDPGTTNAGAPRYVESSLGASLFAATGSARNWRANDSVFTLAFPAGFTFPFYGTSYSSVFVSTNGLLQFGVNTSANDASNTTAELLTQRRITALWDDLTTALTGDDIFVDTLLTDRVTVRWNASRIGDNSDVQFAVTLVNTGEIQFHYGPGNANLSPTVGISAGNGVNYELSPYDGQAGLTAVNSRGWTLQPGLTDIGAFEFQGDSSDVTPPTVTGITPAGIAAGGSVLAPVTGLVVSFSEPLDAVSARSSNVYELLGDGLDNQFDTADDLVIDIDDLAYTAGSLDVSLTFAQPLPTDRYRLSLISQPGQSLLDQAGNRLDGDANGSAGGDYLRIFHVVTGVGTIADANGAPDQVAENSTPGTLVGITAAAIDPDPSDTVTYSLDNNAGGRFAIHPTTGVVTVAGALDREATSNQTILVRATSTDGTVAIQPFTIAILDVNEFNVGPISDANPALDAVNENAPHGTTVGVTVLASDADATTNAITYSLLDSAGGRFAIDPAIGVLSVANGSLLDAESATSHNVTVRALSADGSHSDATFTIQVHDVDEFDVGSISDLDGGSNQVAEHAANGTPVGIVAFARDADITTSAVVYTLDENAGGRFAIHPTTGIVTVANGASIDLASATSHAITVRATSADGSTTSRGFTIKVVRAGDFDGDGTLSGDDIDALSAAAIAGTNDGRFDVTGDGLVTVADVQSWITQLKGTLLGDANLDFVVDTSDFNLWNAHKFTFDGRWTHGNFNADAGIDSSDFNVWNAHKFTFVSPPRPADPDEDEWTKDVDRFFEGTFASAEW